MRALPSSTVFRDLRFALPVRGAGHPDPYRAGRAVPRQANDADVVAEVLAYKACMTEIYLHVLCAHLDPEAEHVAQRDADVGGLARDPDFRDQRGGVRRLYVPRVRVRVDIIGHARIKYVGKYQSCMVISGQLIVHASYV